MTIRTQIADGAGTSRAALVTENQALRVQVVPESSKGLPPEDLANLRLLRDFLVDSGSSNDMNVDGSTTSVRFDIVSDPGVTKWITGIRILMEGANLEINTNDFRRFGNATSSNSSLPNGVVIRAEQSGVITNIVAEPIGIIGDFLSYADDFLNLVNAVSNTSDFLSFDFDFDKPVVLAEGGSDSLFILVQDDLTPIDKMQCLARGYQETV